MCANLAMYFVEVIGSKPDIEEYDICQVCLDNHFDAFCKR